MCKQGKLLSNVYIKQPFLAYVEIKIINVRFKLYHKIKKFRKEDMC